MGYADELEFHAPAGERYSNDRFQARLVLSLLTVAAIMSVLLILWALGVV